MVHILAFQVCIKENQPNEMDLRIHTSASEKERKRRGVTRDIEIRQREDITRTGVLGEKLIVIPRQEEKWT